MTQCHARRYTASAYFTFIPLLWRFITVVSKFVISVWLATKPLTITVDVCVFFLSIPCFILELPDSIAKQNGSRKLASKRPLLYDTFLTHSFRQKEEACSRNGLNRRVVRLVFLHFPRKRIAVFCPILFPQITVICPVVLSWDGLLTERCSTLAKCREMPQAGYKIVHKKPGTAWY